MTTTTPSEFVIQDEAPELVTDTDGTKTSKLPEVIRAMDVGQWVRVPDGKKVHSVRTAVSKVAKETGRSYSVRKAKDNAYYVTRNEDPAPVPAEAPEAVEQ